MTLTIATYAKSMLCCQFNANTGVLPEGNKAYLICYPTSVDNSMDLLGTTAKSNYCFFKISCKYLDFHLSLLAEVFINYHFVLSQLSDLLNIFTELDDSLSMAKVGAIFLADNAKL